MYFSYDEETSIKVPTPFNRVMTPLMTTDIADKPIDFSVHYTEWAPGAKVDEHAHPDSTEAMIVVSGSGIGIVEGKEFDLVKDSMICALPGETHQIINTGTEVLKCLCIFSPAISAEKLRSRANDAINQFRKNN